MRRARVASSTASIVLSILLVSPAFCAPDWPDSAREELDRSLASIMAEQNLPGAAIGIVIGNEPALQRGYGVATLGADIPVTTRSVFHWASVSKPFVAIAVMQLVGEGKLALDDLVVDRLPYLKMANERYREITLQQLLTHTAGMPDVEDYEWDNPQTDEGALKRWVLELDSAELLFAPGSDREYSNVGFEVLGLVVQEVSGVSFEEYMHAKIFAPLQMNDTSFIASEIDPKLRVSGHVGEPERRIASAYPYNRRHAPSSTLNTNIVDMTRFSQAMLNDGKVGDKHILGEELIAQMWSPAWQSPEDPERMHGLGWNTGRPWGDIFAASHGGHDDGFRSLLYIAPEEDVAIFVVSNDDSFPVGLFVRASLESIFPGRDESEQSSGN